MPVTSTLFCGGDWRWQLCTSGGQVLTKAGGFASERECREVVAMLKDNAAKAIVTVNRQHTAAGGPRADDTPRSR